MMQATPETYGDIRGALGTLRRDDCGSRTGWSHRLRTLLAILGPGLIVMVGDNDAGAFSTYAQAGQNYGTTLLWTLALLVPVLYVNQEMVLRLGTITGVGHARLILAALRTILGRLQRHRSVHLERTHAGHRVRRHQHRARHPGRTQDARGGRRGGARHGGGRHRGFPAVRALRARAGIRQRAAPADLPHDAPAVVGDRARFPGPATAAARAPRGRDAAGDRDRRHDGGALAAVLPAELRHRQAHRTALHQLRAPRSRHRHRHRDLRRRGDDRILRPRLRGHAPSSAGSPMPAGVAQGLDRFHGSRLPGALFALALIDASIIGAAAVSLSSAYAVGDVFSMRHSLHESPLEAKVFYGIYCCLIVFAAALVLIPEDAARIADECGTDPRRRTAAERIGVPAPALQRQGASGAWANSFKLNVFTSLVVGVFVLLSLIFTAAVLFPDLGGSAIAWHSGRRARRSAPWRSRPSRYRSRRAAASARPQRRSSLASSARIVARERVLARAAARDHRRPSA